MNLIWEFSFDFEKRAQGQESGETFLSIMLRDISFDVNLFLLSYSFCAALSAANS